MQCTEEKIFWILYFTFFLICCIFLRCQNETTVQQFKELNRSIELIISFEWFNELRINQTKSKWVDSLIHFALNICQLFRYNQTGFYFAMQCNIIFSQIQKRLEKRLVSIGQNETTPFTNCYNHLAIMRANITMLSTLHFVET